MAHHNIKEQRYRTYRRNHHTGAGDKLRALIAQLLAQQECQHKPKSGKNTAMISILMLSVIPPE